ncbi:MAG: hypothetical protein Q4B80_01815 [Aerococcaceae bacterium]|nr:hypothetical protein [Aerococcaceae bacterium]
MFIKLHTGDSQLKGLISTRKKYSVVEAVDLIDQLEQKCSKMQHKAVLTVIIFKENLKQLKDDLTLGYGEGTQYLVYLENRLKKLYPETNGVIPKEYQQLLSEMGDLYAADYESYRQNPIKLQYVQPENKLKQWLKKWKLPQLPAQLPLTKRQLWIGSGVAAFLGIVTVVALLQPPAHPTSEATVIVSQTESDSTEQHSSKTEQPDLETLLAEKKFAQALEFYPQEFPYIERTIFYTETNAIPYLEEFLKLKPDYQKGHFDLAYLKKDFNKVIELKAEADTDERLVQLAVAYVKQGYIAEAEVLNATLNVESISQLIWQAKEAQAVQLYKQALWADANAIQAQIQSPKLQQFLADLGVADSAIAQVNQKLAAPELKPEEKTALEAQKVQLYEQRQVIIDNLQ